MTAVFMMNPVTCDPNTSPAKMMTLECIWPPDAGFVFACD